MRRNYDDCGSFRSWLRALAAVAALASVASGCSGCAPGFRECDEVDPARLGALPARLSQTGLYADIEAGVLASGVRPFEPRFELWTDGATKRRWIWLPPSTKIDVSNPDAWRFPEGTKLWKEFTRDGVRVETRLLYKHGPRPGAWTPMAYVWKERDAWSAPHGANDVRGTPHDVPSAAECFGCHGGTRSGILGFSNVQLPRQASRHFIGLDDLESEARVEGGPIYPNELPGGAEARAALGYLHANCAHCHNRRRPSREGARCFDPQTSFDFTLRVDDLDALRETATYRTAVGTVVSPGDPLDSAVLLHVRSRDVWWGMPPLGTERVDHDGARTLERWISGMAHADEHHGQQGDAAFGSGLFFGIFHVVRP